ncbi:hypothetical protein RN001_016463, partial [Aquatica leii]
DAERGDVEAAAAMQACPAEAGVGERQQVDLMEDALNGMETDLLPSPKVELLKVNGCKKRKLYQLQQHDSTADRHIDDEEEETEPLRQKQVEKKQQLAEMQQKYVQLCTRMEQSSEDSREVEEIPSDSEQTAMYLGVSQKFLLEQEARMAMEAAVAAAVSEAHNQAFMDVLKTEITASLSNLIDSIVTRFVHQRKFRHNEGAIAAEQLNKDSMMASQLLERKSPKQKPIERILRPPMFQPPKPPGINQVPLYGMNHPFCVAKQQESEQNEALSLVVTPKKKRHKVTDTRITPRTVSRIPGQDGMGMSPASMEPTPCTSPRPPPIRNHRHQCYPCLLLHISSDSLIQDYMNLRFFRRTARFFTGPAPRTSHGNAENRRQFHHPPTLLHPAPLAAAQHGGSPDYGHIRAPSGGLNMDNGDRNSDCNSGGDISSTTECSLQYPFYAELLVSLTFQLLPEVFLNFRALVNIDTDASQESKITFFWVRYPSSAVLKMYFPDIKFNKNNTAQLVKWFSNFREFYYIQMEKYARQAVSEGVKNGDDLHVSGDSELYRVLNLHYNRNNHIEVWGTQ